MLFLLVYSSMVKTSILRKANVVDKSAVPRNRNKIASSSNTVHIPDNISKPNSYFGILKFGWWI